MENLLVSPSVRKIKARRKASSQTRSLAGFEFKKYDQTSISNMSTRMSEKEGNHDRIKDLLDVNQNNHGTEKLPKIKDWKQKNNSDIIGTNESKTLDKVYNMISNIDNKWEIGAAISCLDNIPERMVLIDRLIKRKVEKEKMQHQAALNLNEQLLSKVKNKMVGKLGDREARRREKTKSETTILLNNYKRKSVTQNQLSQQVEELKRITILEGKDLLDSKENKQADDSKKNLIIALNAFQEKFNNEKPVKSGDYEHTKLMRRISTLTDINTLNLNDEKIAKASRSSIEDRRSSIFKKPEKVDEKASEKAAGKATDRSTGRSAEQGAEKVEDNMNTSFSNRLMPVLNKNAPKPVSNTHKTVINENKQARKEIEEDILNFLVKESSDQRINTYLNYKFSTGQFELNTKKIDEMVKNKIKCVKENESLENKVPNLHKNKMENKEKSQDLVKILSQSISNDKRLSERDGVRTKIGLKYRPMNRTAVKIVSDSDWKYTESPKSHVQKQKFSNIIESSNASHLHHDSICNCELLQENYTKENEEGDSFVSLYETKLDSLYRASTSLKNRLRITDSQNPIKPNLKRKDNPRKSIIDIFKRMDMIKQKTAR